MRLMQAARVLLLPINDTPNMAGILPGKLFEYLSVGRPILAIGPATGDVVRVLGGAHLRLDREPAPTDAARVAALFRSSATPTADHGAYARDVLAGEVAGLLDTLLH